MPNILPENLVVQTSVVNLIFRLWGTPVGDRFEVILIAPRWASQPWFPHLLRLSVDHLLRFFQYRRDLLSQQGYISSGKSYHLRTWRLLCSTTKQQDFQGRSLSLLQLLHVGDPPQIENRMYTCTMTGGYASLPGLQGEDLIRLSRVTGPV